MSDQVSEKDLHSLVSSLRSLLGARGDALILISKKDIYSREKLAILERYADVVLGIERKGRRTVAELFDAAKNEKLSLGEMDLTPHMH